MALFEESIIVIGVIIGIVAATLGTIILSWRYGENLEQGFQDTKKYEKESNEISKKLDKLKETTNQDDVLPKGFKKDAD
jgi:hypothetical protein